MSSCRWNRCYHLPELEVISISVECMVALNVSDSMLGCDLWKMILDKIPPKPGLHLVVYHTSRLALNESLQQQVLGGQRAQLSATYILNTKTSSGNALTHS